MDTMEITKFVGAICGSLLIFLLLGFVAEEIYHTESDEVAYAIEVEEAEPAADAGEAAVEEVDMATLMAEADAGGGEGVFKRCASCHKLDGSNGVGPHLDGVIDRDIASVDGFSYSDTLSGLDGTWDVNELSAFLADPKGYAPGTKMSFAGLSKPEDRADVIAYIESGGN